MTGYRLYQMQDSGNCYKIRLLMSLLNLNYEIVEVDILKGESRTEDFLEKNPNGRVPTLEIENGQFLSESNAILWFLGESSEYFPTNKIEQARVFQWMGFEQYSHEPFIATSRYLISILKQPDEYAREIQEKKPAGYAALDVMERHLNENKFFVAESFSIADIALYAYTHVAPEGGFDLAGYPAVCRWIARVEAIPGYTTMNDQR